MMGLSWQRAPVNAEPLRQHSPVIGATVGRVEQRTQLVLHRRRQPTTPTTLAITTGGGYGQKNGRHNNYYPLKSYVQPRLKS